MIMSDKQLIICVETTKRAGTDSKYISRILKEYYNLGENKISYVFLEGKYNYNQPKVVKRIEKYKRDYLVNNTGKSYIIYVTDKDDNMSNPADSKYVADITKYCSDNKYQLVWFVKTIEDVVWGETVSDKDKVKKSIQYVKSKKVKFLDKQKMSAENNVNSRHKSNILTVFNQFLKRKQ